MTRSISSVLVATIALGGLLAGFQASAETKEIDPKCPTTVTDRTDKDVAADKEACVKTGGGDAAVKKCQDAVKPAGKVTNGINN